VHRAKRCLRPRRSVERQGRGLESTERCGDLRNHNDAERRGLVWLARGRTPRQDPYRGRRCADGAAAETRCGAAPYLVGFQRTVVGELLEYRGNRSLRPDEQGLESLEPSQE